jgi:UDP-N-acetylglucosamine 2-epimerase (non-hydrolysing)
VIFIAQHASPNLSDQIFEDLAVNRERITTIPLDKTEYGARLGEIISRYTKEMVLDRPDLAVVFGDVDVTLGAALAAKRAKVPLAHIEAGLRSGDMDMPEEMNRILVDAVADLLYAPSEDASNNLVFGEAKDPKQVHFVGNIMIDSLALTLDAALQSRLEADYGIKRGEFGLATFHRPSTVDSFEALSLVVELLENLASRIPIVLPLHPRTETSLRSHGLRERIAGNPSIIDVDAVRYTTFVNLLAMSRLVVTDSGGIQEEASYLGVPCLTYRDNTERPVTVRLGTNTLVNRYDVEDAINSVLRGAAGDRPQPAPIPLWDGKTALRIAASIRLWWSGRA